MEMPSALEGRLLTSPNSHVRPKHERLPRLSSLNRHRYLVLSAAVVALVTSQTLNGAWVGDFWEHAAAVRELARAPFDPNHPLFALDDPHLDFAPYPLLLGLVSRATGLSAVNTLEVAGLVNLVLLLVGLRLFVRVFTSRGNAPFYALLFLLLLYGWSPWEASGLLNLNSIGFVLSYPATFAIMTSFFAVALFDRWLRRDGSLWALVLVGLLAAVGTITHPVSASFVYPALGVVSLRNRSTERRVLVATAATVAGSIALALVWPYFSLVSLFTDNVGLYDQTNKFIYDGVATKATPLILVVPLVWIRLRRDPRDPISLLAVLYALLYAYGAISEHWNWGRTISFEFIVAFILLGDFAANLETGAESGELGRVARVGLAIAASLLLVVELVNMRSGLEHARPGVTVDEDQGTDRFPDYAAIFRGTDRDAVTLAGLRTGRGIPVYGGKVVAYNNPQAFVHDHLRRQADVRSFFSSSPRRLRGAPSSPAMTSSSCFWIVTRRRTPH